jgi:type I site-specific restriction endonuclease
MIPTKSDALQSLRPGAEWVLRGDVLEWLDQTQTEPTEAEIQAELARLIAEQPWEVLRAERNRLLSETDYLALSDHVLSAEMIAYRQALRDLPANTVDPANPVWPVKPGGN